MRRLAPVLALALPLLMAAAAAAAEGQATCADTYKIYQTCYDGGKAMDLEGCSYVVQALGPRLMGEEGVSGLSAALSVGMCKQGCEDGAKKKPPMSMSTFSSSFCRGLKQPPRATTKRFIREFREMRRVCVPAAAADQERNRTV